MNGQKTSLHYLQSDQQSFTLMWWKAVKFLLSFYNQGASTGDWSATLSFKAMHCWECCFHQGNGTMYSKRQVVQSGRRCCTYMMFALLFIFRNMKNFQHLKSKDRRLSAPAAVLKIFTESLKAHQTTWMYKQLILHLEKHLVWLHYRNKSISAHLRNLSLCFHVQAAPITLYHLSMFTFNLCDAEENV